MHAIASSYFCVHASSGACIYTVGKQSDRRLTASEDSCWTKLIYFSDIVTAVCVQGWNNLTVDVWTHARGGITENDFILAAKLDAVSMDDLLRKRKSLAAA